MSKVIFDECEAYRFAIFFDHVSSIAYDIASGNGFWADEAEALEAARNHNEDIKPAVMNAFTASKIALIHSELSEALEGVRHGNPQSEKIPNFTNAEEEMADAVIRIMDLAVRRGWDLSGAVLAKIAYNAERPYKHGKML